MTKTLLLFDVDGTLLRTNGAGMKAMRLAAARLFGDAFTWDGIRTAGGLDPLIFAEAASRNRVTDHQRHHRAFHDHYIQHLEAELAAPDAQVTAMPGVLETLATLRRRVADRADTVLGLLTGNYTRAVPIKLAAVGINPDWFTVTAFGDEAAARPDLVELAMRRFEEQTGRAPDPRRVVVIGDTPRDIECAHAHHCIAFAVATGPYSVAELREAGADVVTADLADPVPLLKCLDP